MVDFENAEGTEEGPKSVPTRFCIPISGAISRPSLQLRDSVLVRCNNADNGQQCYAPGIVCALPTNQRAQAKFYSVKLFTGRKVSERSSNLRPSAL